MFDANALPVPDLGLACKRCGHALAGLREHRCGECGRPFTLEEYLPAGDCPVLIAEGVEVRGTAEVIELLWVYQIPFIEVRGPVQNVLGPLWPAGSRQPARIGVPRAYYFEAIDLIRRQRCGEAMPEPPRAALREADWSCAGCGEMNPSNFDVCWNCGGLAPDIDWEE